MDGVSRGLMMRVAVCGWGVVRGDAHESADRGGTRRERERIERERGGRPGGRGEAGRGVHMRARRRGGGSDD